MEMIKNKKNLPNHYYLYSISSKFSYVTIYNCR